MKSEEKIKSVTLILALGVAVGVTVWYLIARRPVEVDRRVGGVPAERLRQEAAAGPAIPGEAARPDQSGPAGLSPSAAADPEEVPAEVSLPLLIAELIYGQGPGEIGRVDLPEVERQGPQSFAVDGSGYLYLVDTVNGRIQVFSPEGEFLSEIPEEGYITDLVVSAAGDIILLNEAEGVLRQYDRDGAAGGEVTVPLYLLSEKDILHYEEDRVYMRTRDQEDYEIGRLEDGRLVEGGAEGEDPPPGMWEKGKFYRTKVLSENQGEVVIRDEEGLTWRRIELEVDRLASLVFLGEDDTGDIYLQVEQVRPGGVGIDLGVFKLNAAGELVASLERMPNNYDSWTARLLQMNDQGEIYQMLPAPEAVYLHTWKWE